MGHSYHLLVLLFMQNGAALPPGMKEAVFLKTIEDDKWASNPAAFARRCMMRKLRELVAAYDERGGSAVEYRIPSFAEAKAEFWRVQAILGARGLGGRRGATGAGATQGKVWRTISTRASTAARWGTDRRPRSTSASGSRRSKPRETTICRKSKRPCLEVTCRGSASCRPRARSRTARSTSWTDRR